MARTAPIVVDGRLDEAVWRTALAADGFRQSPDNMYVIKASYWIGR